MLELSTQVVAQAWTDAGALFVSLVPWLVFPVSLFAAMLLVSVFVRAWRERG